jgi:TonB family protein
MLEEPAIGEARRAAEPAPPAAASEAPGGGLNSPEPAAGSAQRAPEGANANTSIYSVGGDVQAPVAIYHPSPDFSKIDLRGRRVGGVFIIEAIINEKGEVQEVRVLKPTIPEIDAAIVDSMKHWRFKPATLHGKPVKVSYHVTVNIHWK